jgi:hypothetical protein
MLLRFYEEPGKTANRELLLRIAGFVPRSIFPSPELFRTAEL